MNGQGWQCASLAVRRLHDAAAVTARSSTAQLGCARAGALSC